MKKKIFSGIAVCLFAVTMMFNIGISQQSNFIDITLEKIQVMTQAFASESVNCPYGCVAGNTGCTCNGYYPNYKDYSK